MSLRDASPPALQPSRLELTLGWLVNRNQRQARVQRGSMLSSGSRL